MRHGLSEFDHFVKELEPYNQCHGRWRVHTCSAAGWLRTRRGRAYSRVCPFVAPWHGLYPCYNVKLNRLRQRILHQYSFYCTKPYPSNHSFASVSSSTPSQRPSSHSRVCAYVTSCTCGILGDPGGMWKTKWNSHVGSCLPDPSEM